MSSLLSSDDLGQGFTLDQLESASGHIYYRICTRGTCRYAEDHYMCMMYAEAMGWLPPHRQVIGSATT
jgi:hypothetical protein